MGIIPNTVWKRLGCPVVQLQKSTCICHSGWWLRHPSSLVIAILVKWEHPQYECETIIMCRAWVYVPYHMDFSENGGTPKLSWIRPFQYWNPWLLGDPPFWETAMAEHKSEAQKLLSRDVTSLRDSNSIIDTPTHLCWLKGSCLWMLMSQLLPPMAAPWPRQKQLRHLLF